MAVRDVLITLEYIGFTEVVLPFIFVFTLVFAILQKSKILGADSKGRPKANYNAMIAVIIGFFVLVLVQTLEVIIWFTRYAALLLVAFFFLAFIFALLGVRESQRNLIIFLALMLLAFLLLYIMAWVGLMNPDLVNRFLMPILIVVFLIGLVVFMIKAKPEQPAEKTPEKKHEEVPGFEHAGTIKRGEKEKEEEKK